MAMSTEEWVEKITAYREETVTAIRAKGSRLNALSDEAISYMYHSWSEDTGSAGWLHYSDYGIAEFISWATTAPCDREDLLNIKPEENQDAE
jgi:hypothetical protein